MRRDRNKSKRIVAGAVAFLIILAMVVGMIVPFFY